MDVSYNRVLEKAWRKTLIPLKLAPSPPIKKSALTIVDSLTADPQYRVIEKFVMGMLLA